MRAVRFGAHLASRTALRPYHHLLTHLPPQQPHPAALKLSSLKTAEAIHNLLQPAAVPLFFPCSLHTASWELSCRPPGQCSALSLPRHAATDSRHCLGRQQPRQCAGTKASTAALRHCCSLLFESYFSLPGSGSWWPVNHLEDSHKSYDSAAKHGTSGHSLRARGN